MSELEKAANRKRLNRIFSSLITCTCLFAVVIFYYDNILKRTSPGKVEIIIDVVLTLTILALGARYMFLYLEGSKTAKGPISAEYLKSFTKVVEGNSRETALYNYALNEKMKSIEDRLTALYNSPFNEQQAKELIETVKLSFNQNLNEDFYASLNKNLTIEIAGHKQRNWQMLYDELKEIKVRMRDEISKLSRRANLNLSIGAYVTLAALCLLFYSVFYNPPSKFTSWPDLAVKYLPRLSLVIFVEIFAYFFLKMYKSTLNDLKYYQNELTTVEMKLASMITAVHYGNDADITLITSEFAKTERNFILKKDESTVEIEKSKVDKDDVKDIMKLVSDLVGKKEK